MKLISYKFFNLDIILINVSIEISHKLHLRLCETFMRYPKGFDFYLGFLYNKQVNSQPH